VNDTTGGPNSAPGLPVEPPTLPAEAVSSVAGDEALAGPHDPAGHDVAYEGADSQHPDGDALAAQAAAAEAAAAEAEYEAAKAAIVEPPEEEDDGSPAKPPLEESSSDEAQPTGDRHWYILKVQSNREDSIREALQRKVAMAGLQGYFGDIIVPVEMVSEFKNGKKRVVKRKLYPGYLVVHMELNEETWFLVREVHGIGDFTGSGGKPSPMLPHEVAKIVSKQEEKLDEAPKLNIKFRPGDRVKITEGTFENFEGDVDAIDEANGRVTVMINIFGRSTPVELEYWQVESL